ncbi:glycoside hydrolase family 25 protein [Paenibacillus macquariensis]|uniref:Lysozyme n=1 Tax=Paenibacillus macquariensis TaxID=948756 RepID=A0ABY1KDC9_9BACL|nr:glycoside hydrolase family 25 protein [Paenibacillus macquariensis]MEC0091931.1 glycoside hydrolase family 25 protein [Paenibacillus macquariensis]OAB24975.1 hypothetical protein PMSM_28480 [Paenibacillus macquariensis subsp. macquariensis]SIR65061.1 lysozyme [Paenibacillus macquariensis]
MQNRSKGNAQGIDVSHWQGVIDWKKVVTSGISFVFIKATQNSVDKKFLDNVKGAKAAGLLVGAYHYIDDSITSVDKARMAAQAFFRSIQAAGGVSIFDLPPVMDYESNKNNLSKALISAIAKAFLEDSFIGNFTGLNNYPLWIARYNASTASDNGSGWSCWEFWQYSDGVAGGVLPIGTRKVNGIAGQVDLNEFNGTIVDLKAKYGKQIKPEKDEVKVDPEDVNAIIDKYLKPAWGGS